MSDDLRHTTTEPRSAATNGASPATTADRPMTVPTVPVPAMPVRPEQQSPTEHKVPHTRTGAAWFGICAAALAVVVLIIFIAQNTGSVEVTFLWMHGELPLALALLIAGVSTAIVAMAVGAARIAQLRRLFRHQRP